MIMMRQPFIYALLLFSCASPSWTSAEEYPPDGGMPALFAEGKYFLKGRNPVRLCVDPDWEPYERLDENGRHVGIIAGYFSLLQKRSTIRMEVEPTRNWAQSMEFIKQRRCDIISALNDSEERNTYLSFTAPFIREPSVLITRADVNHPVRLQDMAGKTMAVVAGYIYDTNLRLDYPDIERIYVDNIQDGLRQVAEGKIDGILGRRLAMDYWIRKLRLDSLAASELIQYQSLLRIGVRNDYGELYLILNRAIKSLNNQDHRRLRQAYIIPR